MHLWRWLLCLVVGCGLLSPARADEKPPTPVRLAVLVVFDQFRGDYLGRWGEHFEKGGFRRLTEEGAWFQNCHYLYSGTLTGAGHASLATGCPPSRHGIVGNEWYDRHSGTLQSCVRLERYVQVPPPSQPVKGKKYLSAGPDHLRSPTVADALKKATSGKGKVVSLSFKDRSAVLPGGRKPDACYWFDTVEGRFVTSTYYRARPHDWVEKFNRGQPADLWFDHDWGRLRPRLDYAKLAGPDDVKAEGTGSKQGRTFPHRMTGGLKRPGPAYYDALYNSPFGNELLLNLVKTAIDAEKLGADDVPDLLCVSFSCNDPIGHCWGPDSQEVLDVTLRSDLIVRALLEHLDARVGKGRYLLVLTADHGVCPLPEVSLAKNRQAGRIPVERLVLDAEEHLDKTFGVGPSCIEAVSNAWLYLDEQTVRRRKLTPARVEETLAKWLATQPGIQAAYSRTRLAAGLPRDDAVAESVRQSFFPDRCGDVAVIVKPYYLLSDEFRTGTTHGTPHEYDTHVPLLVYGPGVKAGIRKERISPLSAAAILSHALGIDPPADAQAPLPRGLW